MIGPENPCYGHWDGVNAHFCGCIINCAGGMITMAPMYVHIQPGGSIEVGDGGEICLPPGSVIEALPEGGFVIRPKAKLAASAN